VQTFTSKFQDLLEKRKKVTFFRTLCFHFLLSFRVVTCANGSLRASRNDGHEIDLLSHIAFKLLSACLVYLVNTLICYHVSDSLKLLDGDVISPYAALATISCLRCLLILWHTPDVFQNVTETKMLFLKISFADLLQKYTASNIYCLQFQHTMLYTINGCLGFNCRNERLITRLCEQSGQASLHCQYLRRTY